LFEAIGLILSKCGCTELLEDAAAVDFVRDAFGHLKAIRFTGYAMPLMKKAGVEMDEGTLESFGENSAFLAAASTRQWNWEPKDHALA
jgi:catalase